MPLKARNKRRVPNKGRATTRRGAPIVDQPGPVPGGKTTDGVAAAEPTTGLAVVKSHNSNFGILLAQSPTNVTLLHFSEGPFKIEILSNNRSFHEWWKVQPDLDAKTLAQKWLHHPLGIALRGSDESLDAIIAIAADKDWTSRKVVKVERQAAKAGAPSGIARTIIAQHDYMNTKTSKAIYDACEKAGVNRKLAASVLCHMRKRLK